MKVVKTIKNIVLGIIAVVFFGFAIGMTILVLNFNKYGVTEFNDSSMVIIKDKISSENYKKGDLIIVKKKKLDEIKVGDEIFIYKLVKEGGATVATIDVGIIGEVYLDDNAISYENGSTYSAEYIIGSADKVYENIGNYMSVILSRWGFLFIILVPSLLIFIYEIYAIVVEIKYGKNETAN